MWESNDEKDQRPKKKRKGGVAEIEAAKDVAPVTVVGFDPAEDVLLAKAYNELVRATWVLVSQRITQKGGTVHDPKMCARRYGAL